MSRWADEFETEILSPNPHAKTAKTAKRSILEGFGSFGSFGMGKSDGNSELDRVRVPSAPSASEPDNRPEWNSETRQLIDWFTAATSPAEPFELCRGVTIRDPAQWWQSIRCYIECGPDGPRARYGAVQGDLRRLHALTMAKSPGF